MFPWSELSLEHLADAVLTGLPWGFSFILASTAPVLLAFRGDTAPGQLTP